MDLRESSLGFYRVWIAAVGERHGLWPRLRRTTTTAALARAAGLDVAMTRRWCLAAEAVGLLVRERGGHAMPDDVAARLGDPEDPRYMGHHFRYLADKSLGFGALDDLLRGEPVRVEAAAAYDEATRWDHLAFFEIVLPREKRLRADLQRGIDVLDLGCGSGGWTRAAAERFPRSRFVAADVDAAALRRARGTLGDAARVVRADRVAAASFDVVFMGEVLGAAKDPRATLRSARRALRPGGRLVALEGLRSDGAPRGWGPRLVGAMDFDFALDGSRYLAKGEAMGLLRAAGLAGVRAHDLGGSLFALHGRVTGSVKRPGRASRAR
jgi:SAM-dependent methyltransferase